MSLIIGFSGTKILMKTTFKLPLACLALACIALVFLGFRLAVAGGNGKTHRLRGRQRRLPGGPARHPRQ